MKEPLNTSGSIYETVSEATDIKLYENLKKVVQCRLFIDPENKFLWPPSDGVLGDEGVTEVKYLQSIKGWLIIQNHMKNSQYIISNSSSMLSKHEQMDLFQVKLYTQFL